MEVVYTYTKMRCNMGRQPLFCEQGPELCDSIPGDVQQHRNYILRNPVHEDVQNAPRFGVHYVNTAGVEYTTTGMNHAEGGWPKDVNVVDPEATQRYRRKIEKDDPYIHCVMSQAAGMEYYTLQNNAIDMYHSYYSHMPPQPEPERFSCRTVNVYRDSAGDAARPVSSVCWDAEGHHFATTYCDVDFYRKPRASVESYVWDLENANNPMVVLTPTSALLDLQFNARHPQQLSGGMMNGQVAVFDQRSGGAAVASCPAHVAHRDLVRSVLYVSSKSGQEFFSGGADGACKWWDVRNLSEPTEEMIMDMVKSSFDVPSMARAHGVSVLEFESTLPTRFMCGTDNGSVLSANRKGKTPLEKLNLKYDAHLGPVWSLQRNPANPKNFMTVGDWTVRVWSEECRESAILWSPPLRHKLTAAAWSPARISLLVATQWDGMLAAWDLLRRQHEPTLAMQVCEEPLLRLAMHPGGALVACGSRAGRVYMVQLSPQLAQSDAQDKSLLLAIFDRETKRERILEARMKEFRLRLRQAEEGGSPAAVASELELGAGDHDLAAAAADYSALVKKEQASF